jgi:hypothetical protein
LFFCFIIIMFTMPVSYTPPVDAATVEMYYLFSRVYFIELVECLSLYVIYYENESTSSTVSDIDCFVNIREFFFVFLYFGVG